MAGAKVMIVEDEIITAAALRKDLQNLGYSICSLATSGEKAIKTAEQEQPDVILMDIILSSEIDGFQAGREIQSRFGIPIIYMSGYPVDMVKEKTGITEPYEYLVKPLVSFDLKKAIEVALQKNNEA